MKELAVTRNDLAQRVATGLVATTRVPSVGFSSKLALTVLWQKLEDDDPYCSIELLTRKAARAQASQPNIRKMRRRIPRFRIQLLDDGILLVTIKDSRGRASSFILFHKDADQSIIDLALKEIDEREARCELTKDRANQMRKIIKRSKPEAKLVKQTKTSTQFLLSFDDPAPLKTSDMPF